MTRRFEGQAILVTGAGSGIGRARPRRFGAEGGRVCCADVNAAAAEADGGAPSARPAARPARRAATSPIRTPWRAPSTPPPPAGAASTCSPTSPASAASAAPPRSTFEEWNRIIGVNLTGTFLMCQRALPHILKTQGAIINTASVAGLKSHPYCAAYCASKGGVVMLTKALAVEYGRKEVRINCLCPGGIETPLISQFQLPEGVTQAALMRIAPARPAWPARRGRRHHRVPRLGRRHLHQRRHHRRRRRDDRLSARSPCSSRASRRWGVEVDVLVIGTGGPGLVAALAAHDAGAKVAIVEKTAEGRRHHRRLRRRAVDPQQPPHARGGHRRLAGGGAGLHAPPRRRPQRRPLVERFLDTAPAMIRTSRRAGLPFKALSGIEYMLNEGHGRRQLPLRERAALLGPRVEWVGADDEPGST